MWQTAKPTRSHPQYDHKQAGYINYPLGSLWHWIYMNLKNIISTVIKGHWRGCSPHLNYPNSVWNPARSISTSKITTKSTLPFTQQWHLVNLAALISVKWCGFVKNEGTILQTSRFIVNSFWTAHGGCIPVILLITPHHTDTPMPIPSPFVSSSVMFGCPLIGGFKINQISMTHCWSPCFGSNPIQLLNRMSIHSFSATPYHSVIYRRWICHCTPLYHEIIWHLHIFHVSPQTNLYYISIYSSGFTSNSQFSILFNHMKAAFPQPGRCLKFIFQQRCSTAALSRPEGGAQSNGPGQG